MPLPSPSAQHLESQQCHLLSPWLLLLQRVAGHRALRSGPGASARRVWLLGTPGARPGGCSVCAAQAGYAGAGRVDVSKPGTEGTVPLLNVPPHVSGSPASWVDVLSWSPCSWVGPCDSSGLTGEPKPFIARKTCQGSLSLGHGVFKKVTAPQPGSWNGEHSPQLTQGAHIHLSKK